MNSNSKLTRPSHRARTAISIPIPLFGLVSLVCLLGVAGSALGASAGKGAGGSTSQAQRGAQQVQLSPGGTRLTEQPQDCGLVWRVVPSPNSAARDFLAGLYAVSANDIWATGNYYSPNPHGMMLHWNGTAWSVVTIPEPGIASFMYRISGTSSTDIWAVGYYYTDSIAHQKSLIIHWNGTAWSQVTIPIFGTTTEFLTDIQAVAPDAAWAVGSHDSQTLVLFWDGTTWASITSPNPDVLSILAGVTALTTDDMWAVGLSSSGDFATERTLTIHCSRSGCSTVASPNEGVGDNALNSVVAISSGEVYAVGSSEVITNPSTVVPLAIGWDGIGWNMLPTPPLPPDAQNAGFSSVSALASNNLWAGGYVANTTTGQSQTYAAHFDGSAWTTFSPPNRGTINEFNGIAIVGPDNIWAVGSSASNNSNDQTLIERYSDPCATPSPTNTPIVTDTPSPAPTSQTCTIQFSDVPAGSTFYSFVQCLACRNILGGYSSGCPSGNPCFKPGSPVTRGQLAKIVSNSAGYSEQHSEQTFQDVSPGSTFYYFVQRLASRGIIGGYACGGSGEPCVPPANLPYFRPNAQVTRGQTSKIVAIAASLPAPPAGQQTFQDMLPNSTFWQWIEALATTGTIGGYPCGGAGEPCVPPHNRPYFRPTNNVTRGQAAKIVSNTFFPNCQSHQSK